VESLGEPPVAALNWILHGAMRMESLIHDLLAFTRAMESPGNAENARTSAAGALQDALSSLTAAIHDSGALIETGDLPAVRMDQGHQMEVFQDLLGNAL